MINKIKKLLGIHVHEYSNWETSKVMTASNGMVKVIQHRVCTSCNYIHIRSQEA